MVVIGRPDWQLCDRLSKILLKFFPVLSCVRTVVTCRPDSCTFTASNFHIKASCVRTKGMVVRKVDQMHAISISDARGSGPRGLTSEHLDFECNSCLMNERVWTGFHIVRTVVVNFPYLCFGKKSRSWSNTECHSDVLLKRPDGCKLEQFEAFRQRGRSERKVLVVRTEDALDTWASGRYITSSEQLVRNRIFLTSRMCRIFWKYSE
jgi:hypothetical protein